MVCKAGRARHFFAKLLPYVVNWNIMETVLYASFEPKFSAVDNRKMGYAESENIRVR